MRIPLFLLTVISLSLTNCKNLGRDEISVGNPETSSTNLDNRFGWSDIKDGAKTLKTNIGGGLTVGYEKFKNLFSKDRTMDDYYLNKIDTRFGEISTESASRFKRVIDLPTIELLSDDRKEILGDEK